MILSAARPCEARRLTGNGRADILRENFEGGVFRRGCIMRLSAKLSDRRFTLVGFAVFGTLAFNSAAITQTIQPKASPQAQPAPTQAPAQPAWVVVCANSQSGLDCRAGQSLSLDKRGQAKLNVAVRVPADTKKPVIILQLPLGLYLPAGVSLQIGKDAAKALPFQSCDQGGCVAEYPITEGELAAMLKGADLTVSAQNRNKQPFQLNVSVAGFPAAYAKIRSGPPTSNE
jgi:invasion protein IalB